MKTMLTIDTTTEACSVAILSGGEIREKFQIIPRLHGELILKMVDEMITDCGIQLKDIDFFGVNCGPGAFTGVRLGISVTQALAFSLNKRVFTINTLEVMAWHTAQEILRKSPQLDTFTILVAMDARLNEIYWQCFQFQDSKMISIGNAEVASAKAVTIPQLTEQIPIYSCGNGWQQYGEIIQKRILYPIKFMPNQTLPHAAAALDLLELDSLKALEPEEIKPIYLREKVAKTIEERNARS